jgi:hypothetical protein
MRGVYLRELLITLNLVLSLPPIPFTTAMIASAMQKSYSQICGR